MKILVAEDDPVSRRLLNVALTEWGFEVVSTGDGSEAFEALQTEGGPQLAVLDWMMPGMTGPEICLATRDQDRSNAVYLILLTSRESSDDVVRGLESGANDYITKPFDFRELRARVQVGQRVISLQHELARRINDLQQALTKVKQLQGLLPICSYCKKIRDDQNYWHQVEVYFTHHSDAQFSHGFCPDCFERVVKPQIDEFLEDEHLSEK